MDDVVLGANACTDGELLDRTRAGDREAFGVLYERRHELVLAFLLKRTRNPEVAMDLMAETFAAALLALVDEPPVIAGSAAPWLFTIARNTMIDSYRRGRVESTARERLALEPVQISDNDVEQVLRVAAETDLLIRLSEELPADQFDALRARVLDERGYEEIARELACSAAVVRKRVSRAIATLRQTNQGKHMSDFHSNYKRQLATAAGELFPAPDARPQHEPNRSHRVPLLAAIVFAMLVLAAAALAATGVIGFGAPVKGSRARGQGPSVTAGVGIPVVGANGNPASVQPLAVSVPDPGGGLPWGMRIVRTTRGLLCLQIGRLLDGRLGVIGQDGQFGDDGLFHELPANVLNPDTCITPSVWTMLSDAGLPAAGALPSPITPCLPPWLHPRVSTPPPCPASDERLIGFGVLGPHAVSVSYMVDGQLHTAATVGRLGAYLVVLRVPPKLAHNFPVLGGKSGLLGSFPIGAGEGEVVSRLEFRFGGRLCQTGFDRQPNGPPQCKSQIAGEHVFVPNIPRDLHAPVELTARRVTGGFDLEVTFTAPAAVTNATVAYGVQVRRPSSPMCGQGGVWWQSIERDVARGESVHVTEFVPQPPGCNGVVKGEVMLGAQTGALRILGSRDETIGRFTFNLPS